MLDAGWREANSAYAMLDVGDRAGAAEGFRLALSLAPEHPNAAQWKKDYKRLTRKWRFDTYAFLRADGTPSLPAGSPVLGAQSVATMVGFSPKPTARRPVEIIARIYASSGPSGSVDPETQQVGVGVAWQPLPKVPVKVTMERLIAIGAYARNDWSVRVSGGHVERWRGIVLDAYGEAGIIGKNPDWFVGGQAAATHPLRLPLGLEVAPGIGVWGARQSETGFSVSRLDVGPTIRLRGSKLPVALSADYRFQVSGNALPGDSAALTISTSF